MKTDIERLQKLVVDFGDRRDWAKYHSPKNLSMALNIESAELMEHFQWLTEEQSRQLNPKQIEEVSYELADVLMYTLLLSERLGIDLAKATEKKIAINEKRFAVGHTNK